MLYFSQNKFFIVTLICWLFLLPGLAERTQAQNKPSYKMDAAHPLAKIGTELAELHLNQKAGTSQIQKLSSGGLRKKSPLQIEGDYVVIEAIAEPNQTAKLLSELKALGMTHAAAYGRMVSGLMPISTLNKVAALPNLHFARPAYKPIIKVGEITSQGDAAMFADSVRKSQVLKGKGSKIGVLSDSYNLENGAEKGVKSGDLPGKGNPNGYTTPVQVLEDAPAFGGIDEGRAMLEIIHDVAPAATLAFHTAIGGQANFAQGILDLQKAGCNIITDDVSYLNEPMFQDGIIAQAVNEVTKKNVGYFSSAGNRGRQSYQAKFKNSGKNVIVNGINYGVAHDFGNGDITQSITLPPGGGIALPLQWDDPFFSVSGLPGAQTDLDVLVFYKGELLPDFSSLEKNVGNDPFEFLGISTDPTDTAEIEIAIVKYSGPDPTYIKWIDFANGEPTEHETNSSTISGHSNAAGAVSTGAVFWGYTPAYGTSKPAREEFSSAGGTPILFDGAGKRIKEVVRRKPEIMGPDGVNTTFFGQAVQGKYYFFGTSAAAPHAAAVAALMQESAGLTLSRDQILKVMQETALDMEDPGFDFNTGYGFLNAFKSVGAVAKPGTRSLVMLNASNSQELQTLSEGSVINLTRLATAKVRFRAQTGPMKVGSVILELNGQKITENKAPYDYPNSTDSFELTPGDYTLTATPYTQAQGAGEAGIPLTIHFKVVEEKILRFELINVANGKVIQTLETGDILYLPALPEKLNIRAITSPAEVGSVQFNLNGIVTIENRRPYDLTGTSGGGLNFTNSLYILSATTYPNALAKGKAGDSKTITFGATNLPIDLAADQAFTVFPNPFAGKAKIQLKAAATGNASLIIYNLNGEPVTTLFNGNLEAGKQYEFELDGSHLPDGFYVSRFVTKSGVAHRTIKLQK
ncbi:S8 family serine peptidase [Adhaeribacter pallidiroseus]|uniref:Uncharacterized protein n=1 Tax=Adhaeribacter pallidiroseus TaxID=2072847 RepID=A0A369QQP0_9BACT|nr:S8 family serine peptidase [Adhaeribacter pallidiroseus]RDC65606.1 hypothetical protein AHMF7616_04236 [Adhaeribacter pallidiroseus]